MKYFTLILLLAASFVSCEPIFDLDKMLQKVDAIGILGEQYKEPLEGCISELKPYTHCTFKYEKLSQANLRKNCAIYLQNDCQDFIADPLGLSPNCSQLPEFALTAAISLGISVVAELDIVCSTDEEDKFCPMSTYYTRFKENDTEFSKIKVYKEDTCKSEKCTNVVVTSFETLNMYDEINRRFNNNYYKRIEFLEYFDSDVCYEKQGIPPPTNNNKYPLSPDGTCGNNHEEVYACPGEECCSKYGYCGLTGAYCETGCQSEFGRCDVPSTSTKYAPTPTIKKIPTSTVKDRCGPEYGACAKSGLCCSQYGYCGTSSAHCDAGCQVGYGICNSDTKPSTTTRKIPTSTVKDRCGPEYGACAKSGLCCSQYGYCGTSSAHCAAGCQVGYGICDSDNTPTPTSRKLIPTSTVKDRCGPDYGYCSKIGYCCSQYGYCGTSSAHCGYGCQSEFGACNRTTKKTTTTTKKTTSTTSKKIPTSTVKDRCGANYGMCANSKYCCSKWSYCGDTGDYCGIGCQKQYGKCW